MLNIDKLFELLADKGFQDPTTGNLFFPAYIYTYPPEKEVAFREQIDLLTEKLKRPNHYLECKVINIYYELINYLKGESFAGKSLFDLLIEKEKEDADDAFDWIRDEITGDEGRFFAHLEEQLKQYFKPEEDKRVYLIIHGFGSIFPYLRTSELLKKTERLIKEFKLIIFYPGKYENSNYSLFGILDDDNMYRANHLNRILGVD